MTIAAAAVLLLAQDSLELRRDRKLDSAFLKQAPWTTDYGKAKEAAAKADRIVFAYFTRSYSP